MGADPLPLQRQRRAAGQPERRERQGDQGVRAVEPELDPVRGAEHRRLDARGPRPRAVPLRERQPPGADEHAQQRDLGEQHAPDPRGPGPGSVQPHAERGDRGLRRRGAHRDLERRSRLAGRPRDRRAAHLHRRLVRGHLRRQRDLRAARGRAVPQPPGAAGRAAQWRLRDPDDRGRRRVRLLRARPALHARDVRAAHERPRVRRPQQEDPPRVAVGVDATGYRGQPDAAAAVVPARRQAAALRGRHGRRQEPVRRNPVRTQPRRTEGAGPVTTFKTAESPFKANNTASGKCGFTLMNNQVGEVVAQVMATKSNVTVTWLPSMMRVDAVGRMEVVYDEVSEALGEDPGYFDQAELEEDMSTHYGRMTHTDDRTIFVANPEDAADYLGFDLTPTSA